MYFFDLIFRTPILSEIVQLAIIVWAFEVFLLPFKLNRLFTRKKQHMERMENLMQSVSKDTQQLEDIDRFSKVIFALLNKHFRQDNSDTE